MQQQKQALDSVYEGTFASSPEANIVNDNHELPAPWEEYYHENYKQPSLLSFEEYPELEVNASFVVCDLQDFASVKKAADAVKELIGDKE